MSRCFSEAQMANKPMKKVQHLWPLRNANQDSTGMLWHPRKNEKSNHNKCCQGLGRKGPLGPALAPAAPPDRQRVDVPSTLWPWAEQVLLPNPLWAEIITAHILHSWGQLGN